MRCALVPSAAMPPTHILARHGPENPQRVNKNMIKLLYIAKKNSPILARIVFSSDVIGESIAKVAIWAKHTGQSGGDKVWRSERTSQYSLIRSQAAIVTAGRYSYSDISARHDWQVGHAYQGCIWVKIDTRKPPRRKWEVDRPLASTSPNIYRPLDSVIFSLSWRKKDR